MFRHSLSRTITAVTIIGLFLSACASPATPAPTPTPTQPKPIVLTDGLKRTISLPTPAKRVVSMAPSNTEILFAIGAGSQVVGRDEFSDYPVEAKSLPSVGGSYGKYNMEAIVNLQPDLVLATEINTKEQVKTLEDLGLTVYLLPNPTDFDGMYQYLMTVAQLTGHETQASSLIERLKPRVKAVQNKILPLSSRPSVFYELDSTDPNAPYTSGPGTFVNLIIDMAGGFNIGNKLSSPWAQISLEELVVQNPAIILLGDSAYGVSVESVATRTGWSALDAVKNKRVYAFDDNLVSRPGPRLVDGLEQMAKLIHPEVFQ